MFNKTKAKLYIFLLGAIFSTPFSALAGEITFSNVNNLTIDDRYIVIIGSQPTEIVPSYIKQIQFDTIDVNAIADITYRSEGVHIDVAEMKNNIRLIDNIHQAYDQGLSLLYFDAHYDKQLMDYRNTFLLDNFNESFSSRGIKAIFNSTPSNTIPANTRLDSISAKASANEPLMAQGLAARNATSPCDGQGLMVPGQLLNIFSAFAPLATTFTVPIDGLAAIFNAGRLIGCNEVDGKFTREDIKLIAREAVTDFAIDQMMNALKNLGYSLQRDLYQIKESAPTWKKERWIKSRLQEAKTLYATLEALGYIASEITAEVAAIETGLIKQLYHIHEGSSFAIQTRIKNDITSDGISVTLFQEQFDTFESQEGTSQYGRRTFHDSLKYHLYRWGCPWFGTCKDTSITYGDCWSTKKLCFKVRVKTTSFEDGQRQGRNLVAGLRNRSRMPRVSMAAYSYAQYFHRIVKEIPANTYPKLKDLLANNIYRGARLEDTVSFHQHKNQKGYELQLPVGRYNVNQLAARGFINNDLSSLSVPPGLVAEVYDNWWLRGWHMDFASDANFIDLLDKDASSIVIKKADAVTVYSNHNQNVVHTANGTFTKGYEVRLPTGYFSYNNLELRRIKNDDIASLDIPVGYTVTLYEHNHAGGWSKAYSASTNLWSKYLNSASSLKIEYANAKNDFVHLRSMNGNGDYCLDAKSSTARQNGGMVGIWPCVTDSDAQKWKYDNKGRLVNKLGGKCMIARWNQQNTPGAPVVVWDCNDSGNRKWTLGHNGHNLVHNAGLCLDIPNAVNVTGKQVTVYTCHDDNNQGWYFNNFK